MVKDVLKCIFENFSFFLGHTAEIYTFLHTCEHLNLAHVSKLDLFLPFEQKVDLLRLLSILVTERTPAGTVYLGAWQRKPNNEPL